MSSVVEGKRLAIVGASVRAAAQSAVRVGFDVVAADLFADADLQATCPATRMVDYPHDLADWLAQQSVDAWFYTGALENYPELVDRMAEIAPLWGVSGDTLRRSRDPLIVAALLDEAGVGFPKTLPRGETPNDASGWLAKTCSHSAGAGVWAFGQHPVDAAVYAQRYVEGRHCAAVFALGDQQHALLGLTEQLLAGGKQPRHGFGYRGSIGPISLSGAANEQLAAVGEALRSGLGLRGIVGVDFVDDNDAVTVIEINPRWTASIEVLERSAVRSAAQPLASCIGRGKVSAWRHSLWTPERGGKATCGKRIVFANDDAAVTPRFAQWAADEATAGRLADQPLAGHAIKAGDPVCTVLAKGLDPRAVRSALRARVAEAEKQLYR